MKTIKSNLKNVQPSLWLVPSRLLVASLMALGAHALAQSMPVPTATVQAKAVGVAVELDGVIQPVRQSTIAAQATGRIATLLVKAGDRVHQGQVLATIDDRETTAGVQKSQAQINQAEADLRNAHANLERTRDLQSKGFVSKAALDTADAQYKSFVAVRDQATAMARQSTLSQSFTRASAPYDGWVLQTHAEAGDLAVPGKPLMTVYAPQPLRATVQVPASRIAAVRVAAQTLVGVEGAQGTAQWIVPVARTVIPSADPVSQTTEWRLELPAKESAHLVPGQQVRVRFTQAQVDPVPRLLVPEAAIVRRGELTAVYVVTGTAFSLRSVRLGASFGGDGVEVQAGVKAGEAVALDPIRAGFANATPAPLAK